MSNNLPMHMRTLIRKGLVAVLLADAPLAARLGTRIYPNRVEHWWAQQLPAAGVYTMSEDNVDSDTSPDPEERKITLGMELLVQATEAMDDHLDVLALLVERAISIDAVGSAMTSIIESRLPEPLPRDAQGRSPVDTALLRIKLTGTDLGIAVDGEQQTGVATLAFDVEYQAPRIPGVLDDFLLAATDWDVVPADGHPEMQSLVAFEPPTE